MAVYSNEEKMITDEAGKLALVLRWQLLNLIPCSELGWILKSRECKDEAVRWSVKFGYLWADNRLCYWHTHYQRPYTSFFCLTLTIVLQGLEWMLLTPELNSRRRTDCWFYFVEIGRGHIFLKQKKKALVCFTCKRKNTKGEICFNIFHQH